MRNKMIKWNCLRKKVLLYVMFLFCAISLWAECTELPVGNYRFAFIMLKDNLPVPIKDPIITREMLKNEIILYYKPLSNSYFYIYAVNPGKEFRQLRPLSFNDFKRLDYLYKPEYIYFSDAHLLETGTDCWEIHVLISTERLPEIEKLISDLTGKTPDMKESLIELTNKLNREILALNVKKILGNNPVELPEPLNSLFRSNDDIKEWLDHNAVGVDFTCIYERIYYYECKKEK